MHGITSSDGSVVVSCGKGGAVIRSTNGGRNWTSLVLGAVQLNSITSSGSNYWIAGNNRAFYRSTDAGITWVNIPVSAGTNYNSVYFVNAQTGWIAGEGGTILRSTDGGLNWSQQTSGTSLKINTIKFLSSNTGIACGLGGLVLKTTDGGAAWQLLTVPTSRELLNIDIIGNSIVAVGEYSVFLRSTNSGNTWTSVDYKISTLSDINSVYLFDENKLFTCGGGGFIRKSTDGGLTYIFPQNPMFGELYRIYFYDQLTGWAISRKSYAVLNTTDGGVTWNLPLGTTAAYNWYRTLQYGYNQCFGDAINTFNPLNKKVIYTLAANKLYRSPDIGETWSQISTLPYAALYSQYLQISPVDTSKMIALLQEPARIYYTSNYGSNWILTANPLTPGIGIPIARHPYDPEILYLGTTSSFYKSTNFGLNWNYVSTLPTTDGVCDIEINYSNPDIMLINTKHPAKIFRSTNGGINFTLTNSDSTNFGESPALCTSIFDTQTAYHLFYGTASKDGIYKSTNFGINWTRIQAINYLWSITYASDDPNVIIAGAWDGIPRPVYITQDGWQSYVETAPLTGEYNGNEAIYAYDKGNILLQQTIGIYKMNVTYFVPAIGIQNISNEVPESFLLEQNFPNPFNPVTKIRFQIPASVEATRRVVSLRIYDVLGKEIAVLVNQNLKPGIYEIEWNAENIPSGVYFYSLITNEFTQTKKMVVLK
jgi:photosystem II stability/assembly factor-like uncharacterized protein